MDAKTDTNVGKCPVIHSGWSTNRDWWPNQLNIEVLHSSPPCPIHWARISTMPRSSRAST